MSIFTQHFDLSGKTIFITGANTGIGKALVQMYLHHDARVIMACRTEQKASETLASVGRLYPNAALDVVTIDLASFQSVTSGIRKLKTKVSALDVAVLNAGVHIPYKVITTDDHHELHEQVNFLSQALLAFGLLPLLKDGTVKQLVYISSDAHRIASLPHRWFLNFWYRYSQSKLRATSFFFAFRQLYPAIRTQVISPGSVGTDVHRHKAWWVRSCANLITNYQEPLQAAQEIVSICHDGKEQALYWNKGQALAPSKRSVDPHHVQHTWEIAMAALGDMLPQDMHEKQCLSTHSGTFRGLGKVSTPGTINEVQELVRQAQQEQATIRVLGKLHSYNDVSYGEHYLLSLEKLDRIRKLDEKACSVTFEPGVQVLQLARYLNGRGYTLRFAGNHGAQTVIGAISTGTHGYYRNGGVLAEAIIRLKVIDSSGKERGISDERELKAWRISLGALGIITEITLSVLPKKQWCHYVLNTLPRASFEQQLPYLCKAYEYFRFYPNHFDERYVNYLTITPFDETSKDEIEQGIRFVDDIPTIPWLTGLFKIGVQNRLFKAIIKTFDIANVTMSLDVPFSTLLFIKASPVNKHYRIAASYYKAWDNPEAHAMELAIAPEDYPRFAELFTILLQQYRNKEPKFFAHYTSRYVGASDKALLAANYQRNVLFMDIKVPQYYIQAVKFLKEFEVTLREHCSVRVHWGKEFFAPGKDVLAAWPEEAIEQFVNIRQTCDPGRMFSNAYVRRLLDTTYRARFLG